MAVKKIIQDAFEQVAETGRDMAKSSVKQVQETFSPWDMIRNSFDVKTENKNGPETHLKNMKEKIGKNGHTPLDFDRLQQSYQNQDKAKADALANRLFQLVKQQDERTLLTSKQKTAEKIQMESYQDAEQKRKNEDRLRMQSQSAAPQGKERKNIFGGKKKRKGTDVQPLEARPNSSKQ